jgi:beta-mannosidase
MAKLRTFLHSGWTVRAVRGDVPDAIAGRTVPASVPGVVHTDLLAAGLIPDPYLDDSEQAVQWIGRADWRYEAEFEVTPTGRVDLVCEGLDTIATIEINGTVVARTANMHRTYRIDVSGFLRAGPNTVAITFASALEYAETRSRERGPRPRSYPHPFNEIRKMACNFGWDWGPELVTAGIWRPIALESWTTARLAAVRPVVNVAGGQGTVAVHVDVERAAPGALRLVARVGDDTAETELDPPATDGVVRRTVNDPALWWPHSHGQQPMYPVEVALRTEDGVILDQWHGRVGFRSVRLDTTPDQLGTPFTLVVNDRPIFARGANWIPDDALPTRVSAERYAQRLEQARDAGINVLRVWGGGRYESDDFYDTCDRLGILVWQDFAFACAAYAEEEPLRGEVEAEARDAVTRLAPHPSLALWNGGNENIWGHADWGWAQQLDGRTWGLRYYLDLLPAIVAELDPTRPYTANSPWSLSTDRHPNLAEHGTMHVWDVWNTADYSRYRDHVPRFVAEFGFQGPPTWATLTRAVHDEPLTPTSPAMLSHQKAIDGNDKLDRWVSEHFRPPRGIADWHWATSLNQARAVAFGLEHFRSWSPRCMGTVVWQLNDCWPVISWSAVDGDGRRKPMWYAMRRCYADRLLTVQPREAGLAVIAVNDTDAAWTGTVVVMRHGFDGTTITRADLPVDVGARNAATLPLPPALTGAGDPARELLTATLDGTRAWWFFGEDRDLALPPADFDADASTTDDGYQVRVTARSLLRDLSLLVDRVSPDAVVDDMLVTLLPGESVSFDVRTRDDVDPAAFLHHLVLRCANQLRG